MPARADEGTPLGPTDFEEASILAILISRLRERNRATPARPLSLAVTHCEEALHWLQALRGQVPTDVPDFPEPRRATPGWGQSAIEKGVTR